MSPGELKSGVGTFLCFSRALSFCSLILCLAASIASAQTYKFRAYGTDDGLRNLAVLCMAQDHDGYVWVGTLNGLYRYNGDRFEHIGDEQGLPESQVVSLAVTPDGGIWAGTGSGVAVFRHGVFEAVHFTGPVTLAGQNSLSVDPVTNALWVATNEGLAKIDSSLQQGTPKAVFVSFAPRVLVTAVSFGADGSIWFASGGNLSRYERNSGVLTPFGPSDGVPNDAWDSILSDRQGQLWARSATRLVRLPKGEKHFSAEILPPAEFGALALQPNGDIAVPTLQGLAMRGHSGWKVLGIRSGLPMDSVSSLLVDRDGSPWIGTNGGGVARWIGFGAWENWTAPGWMEDDAIWSIAEDQSGDIWAGSNTGIMKMTQAGQSGSAPARNRFRLGDVVRSMAVGAGHDLWVGTPHRGLFRCDLASQHCDPVGEESGVPSTGVLTVTRDSEGILWVATTNGTYFGNSGRRPIHFERLRVDGLPPGEQPGMVLAGSRGELFAATRRGLWIRRKDAWEHIGREHGLMDDALDLLAADRAGHVYVTYRKRLGISQVWLEPGGGFQIRQLSEDQSKFIYTLGTDAQDRLWVGTDSGIDRLAGGRWRHYGTSSGLIWTDLNTNAFLADSRHGLWFGTSRGLAHYQPDLDTSSSAAPTPLVTSIVAGGHKTDPSRPFVVPYRSREVTMRFSTLSFADETDTNFEYRIVGLFDDWQPGTGRDLHLLNPPSGSWSLEVTAGTSNSAKRSKPTRLQFTVETPWWRTGWSYCLAAVLCMTLIRAIWYRRMRTLLTRARQLERAVQDRTIALEDRTRELLAEQGLLLEAREELRMQALRDPLTSLWNRRAILEELEMASGYMHEPFVVIMADLDHFKSINDRYGHQCGDMVLRETALRFPSAFRPTDFVGRYGGEELIVILRNCDLSAAIERVEKLRLIMQNEPVLAKGVLVRVTCSFGIAEASPGERRIDKLIAAADEALYEAKRAGRNCVVASQAFALPLERQELRA